MLAFLDRFCNLLGNIERLGFLASRPTDGQPIYPYHSSSRFLLDDDSLFHLAFASALWADLDAVGAATADSIPTALALAASDVLTINSLCTCTITL